MMNQPEILRTTDLDIGYGRKIVQKKLNLSVRQGEFICLIGTNGAGKSTLLRTLACLQKKIGGSVYMQGKEVERLSNKERANLLSLVLTEPLDVRNLSVRELVSMGRFPYTNWVGKLSAEDEAKVETAIEQVNLTHKINSDIGDMSDGEKQRAVIAKALAQDTPLVFLDEPTAHLDLPNRIEIMLLLSRLSVGTKKTFILSTHELDLAMQMSDKLWLMTENGVEVGIPEDFMLSGRFQSAFGSKNFSFDAEDGHCKLHHFQGGYKVRLSGGHHLGSVWMQRALERCGIEVSEEAETVINCLPQGFSYQGKSYSDIEGVLKDLLY